MTKFYVTLQRHHVGELTDNRSYLIPAHIYWNKRTATFSPLNVPITLDDLMIDSGGYSFTQTGKDYPYTLAEYVSWLQSINPKYAVIPDYVCFDGDIETAHERGYAKLQEVRANYADVEWQWIPVLQGLCIADYLDHARLMRPVLEMMQARYGAGFVVGVGSLVRQDMAMDTRARYAEDVFSALRYALSGVKLHGFGVGLGMLARMDYTPNLFSVDSANWNAEGERYPRQSGIAMERRQAMGYTKARYALEIELNEYLGKLMAKTKTAGQVRLF